jgi:glycosyltransferase involved in cell wall biosynthesis
VKVAYIVSLFPKISETFILREMQALRDRGVEILVVSLKRRREAIVHREALSFQERMLYAGSPLRTALALARCSLRQPAVVATALARTIGAHVAHPVLLAKSLPLVATAAELAGRLREAGVDRIHAHWATYPAQVAWAVRILEGIPYSITAHAHDIFLPNPLLREKIRLSDFTVTISEYNRRFLLERCGEDLSDRIRVVHCGIPLEAYPFRPPEAPRKLRVVSIGRFVDYKGFPVLLHAVAALRRSGRDVTCDIVGDGPLRGLVEKEVSALGLNGAVRLLGSRTQEEVKEILRGAAACVLACQRGHDGQMDGIPVVLMEAMALGVPAVATRISGIPEIIEDGRTGLLAEPGSPDSLAAAVERLLSDPGLAARLAAAGRKRVEEAFDISRCAAQLLEPMESAGRGAR